MEFGRENMIAGKMEAKSQCVVKYMYIRVFILVLGVQTASEWTAFAAVPGGVWPGPAAPRAARRLLTMSCRVVPATSAHPPVRVIYATVDIVEKCRASVVSGVDAMTEYAGQGQRHGSVRSGFCPI